MRRLLALTLALLLCTLLALPAAAESSFTSAQCTATVSDRGDAQVLLQFHLSLDQTAEQLVFPLGSQASKVTVNGASVRLKRVGGVPSAALSGGAAWLTLYGGRRSDAGRQTLQTALGLRRYFMTVDRKQLRRIVLRNPGYYYDMAPYALALGADRAFAGQFESMRLTPCTWLTADLPLRPTAAGWYPLLREVMQTLRTGVPRRSDWADEKKRRPVSRIPSDRRTQGPRRRK